MYLSQVCSVFVFVKGKRIKEDDAQTNNNDATMAKQTKRKSKASSGGDGAGGGKGRAPSAEHRQTDKATNKTQAAAAPTTATTVLRPHQDQEVTDCPCTTMAHCP